MIIKKVIKIIEFLILKFIFFILSPIRILLLKLIFRSRFLNFKLSNLVKKRYLEKNLIYHHIKLKVGINSFWDNWRLRSYETYPVDEILNDVEKKNDKIVYYEIGANIGYSAIVIGKILNSKGKVYALEPEPTNFKTLSENIALNKLENITAINIGISTKNEIKKIYYNTLHNPSNFSVSGMGGHSITYNQNLHNKNIFKNSMFISLEKLIEDFSLEKPTHIFIDALGAELNILQAFQNGINYPSLKKIIVDVEEDVANIEDTKVYKFLIENKFKLESVKTNDENTKNLLKTFQSVFVRS